MLKVIWHSVSVCSVCSIMPCRICYVLHFLIIEKTKIGTKLNHPHSKVQYFGIHPWRLLASVCEYCSVVFQTFDSAIVDCGAPLPWATMERAGVSCLLLFVHSRGETGLVSILKQHTRIIHRKNCPLVKKMHHSASLFNRI